MFFAKVTLKFQDSMTCVTGGLLKNEVPKVLPKSPIGKAIDYAIDHYDRLCSYVIEAGTG